MTIVMEATISLYRTVTLAVLILLSSTALQAQDQGDQLDEISQQAANPIADLMSFPFQNNTDFGLGPFDRSSNVLNIQPVIPFAGGRILTRTIFPFVWIPDITAESSLLSSGLADILFTAFYVPESRITWGVGPVLEFPTGGRSEAHRSGARAYPGSYWPSPVIGRWACWPTTSGRSQGIRTPTK